jgi:hypothetical protein
LTTPSGSRAATHSSAKASAVSDVYSAGFSTTVLPAAERRRDLPGQHQQREVPGNDLADDADRRQPRELAVAQLRPARVVVEVARDERDVDVARLADRLAVVERLEHREQARVLLHLARDRVEVGARARAPAARSRRGRLCARPRRPRPPRRATPARSSRAAYPSRD